MARKRRKLLLFENEISWFVLAGALDVVMTFLILRYNAEGRTHNVLIESNPLARWVLGHWGVRGMAAFKFLMIAVVVVIAEFVGRARPVLGRTVLIGGTIVVGAVVVYSMRLLFANL